MEPERIRNEVEALGSLEQAIRWARDRSPRAEFLEVVAQDEFTHDVIVRVDPTLYVVFDTT